MPKVTEFSYLKCHMLKSPFNATKFPSFFLDPQNLSVFFSRVAPDTELAGYPAAGYPANLFCRISGIRPDIRLNS